METLEAKKKTKKGHEFKQISERKQGNFWFIFGFGRNKYIPGC